MSEELRSLRVPTWCPVCSNIMKGSLSISTYYNFNCCSNCFIEFVEGREDKWKKGWRPSKDDIEKLEKKLNNEEF